MCSDAQYLLTSISLLAVLANIDAGYIAVAVRHSISGTKAHNNKFNSNLRAILGVQKSISFFLFELAFNFFARSLLRLLFNFLIMF